MISGLLIFLNFQTTLTQFSTTLTLPVTVGLILFWFDKNLFLSLPEFVVFASTCTEFSLETLPEYSVNVVFGDAVSYMHLFWLSKTFSWCKANVMCTEFITNPKNSIFFTGVSCDILKFITKPKFCERKINVSFACKISFNVWVITDLSSKNIVILKLILLHKAIGIFKRFVKMRGTGPRQKHKQKNSYKFLSHWRRIYFPELFSSGMTK